MPRKRNNSYWSRKSHDSPCARISGRDRARQSGRSPRERLSGAKRSKGKSHLAICGWSRERVVRKRLSLRGSAARDPAEYLDLDDEVHDNKPEGAPQPSAIPVFPAVYFYIPYLVPTAPAPASAVEGSQDQGFDRIEQPSRTDEHKHARASRRSADDDWWDELGGYDGDGDDTGFPPLSHSWYCNRCGNLRSTKFHRGRSMEGDDMPRANWCLQCRMRHEMKARPFVHRGRRVHACTVCGVIRSRMYQKENPLRAGDPFRENICARCRDARNPEDDDGDIPWSSDVDAEAPRYRQCSPREKVTSLKPRTEEVAIANGEAGSTLRIAGTQTLRAASSSLGNQRGASPETSNSSQRLGAVYRQASEAERANETPDSDTSHSSNYRPPSCESVSPSEPSVVGHVSTSCGSHNVNESAKEPSSGAVLSPICPEKTLSAPSGQPEHRKSTDCHGQDLGAGQQEQFNEVSYEQAHAPEATKNTSEQTRQHGITREVQDRMPQQEAAAKNSIDTTRPAAARPSGSKPSVHGYPTARHPYRDPAVVSTGSPLERSDASTKMYPAVAPESEPPSYTTGGPYFDYLGYKSPMNYNDLSPGFTQQQSETLRAGTIPLRKSVHFEDQKVHSPGQESVPAANYRNTFRANTPNFSMPMRLRASMPGQSSNGEDASRCKGGDDSRASRGGTGHRAYTFTTNRGAAAADGEATSRPYDYSNDCATSPNSMDHISPDTQGTGMNSPFNFAECSPAAHSENDEFYSHQPDEAERKWMDDCVKIYMAYRAPSPPKATPEEMYPDTTSSSRTLYDDLNEFDEKLRAARRSSAPCGDGRFASQRPDTLAGTGPTATLKTGLKAMSSYEDYRTTSGSRPRLFPMSESTIGHTGHSLEDEDSEEESG